MMKENRVLRDRAMRRSGRRDRAMSRRSYSRDRRDYEMDSRNPYGSRGGYVSSDRAMDSRNYDAESNRGYDSRRDYNYGASDYHNGYERYGEYNRPMQYDIYGVSSMRRQYGKNQDYNDYEVDGQDYAEEEESYKKDLKELSRKLKKSDRFNLGEEEIVKKAKSMGVKFEDYDEEEFIVTYYMMQSDYPGIANDPHTYLAMAKSFLEDKDAKLQGSEKLCKYIYAIVKGEDEE